MKHRAIYVEPMKVQRRATRYEVKKLLAVFNLTLCFGPVQIPEPDDHLAARFDTSKSEITKRMLNDTCS